MRRYIPALSLEGRMGAIASRNPFFKGNNLSGRPIRSGLNMHLKYTFRAQRDSWEDLLYGAPYHGVGVARYAFNNNRELGNPWAVYLLQGARLARLSSALSLFYEWNLGFSFGWQPYNFHTNRHNTAIGSRGNAYIGMGLYLKWALSPRFDLAASGMFNHFSNGNSQPPNRGVNILTGGLELKYNFGHAYHKQYRTETSFPEFPGHFEYEALFYMTQKGVALDTTGRPSMTNPYPDNKFTVAGIQFAPLYRISHKIRLGTVLDVHVNQSSGLTYTYNYNNNTVEFEKAPFKDQLFMGLAGRVDYILPIFTLSGDIGYNLIHAGANSNRFFQTIAVKMNITKGIFVNVGYRVSNFKNPNFLMLGVGYRFNDTKAKKGDRQ